MPGLEGPLGYIGLPGCNGTDGGDGRARFARTLPLEGGEASLLYPRCLSDPGDWAAGLR